ALELIGRAFALDRRNADCAFNLAQVLRALGRSEEAATHFEQATELRRDYAAAHLALADLHLQQGRFAEAVPRYRRGRAPAGARAAERSRGILQQFRCRARRPRPVGRSSGAVSARTGAEAGAH